MTPHLRCKFCQNYDICQACIDDTSEVSIRVGHQGCPELPDMIYFDPEPRGEVWFKGQMDRANAYLAQQNAKAAEEQRAERQRAERQAVIRRPAVNVPEQRKETAKRIASAFGKVALRFGVALLNAEIQQMNNGGNVYVNDTGGSGYVSMDNVAMGSPWGSVQSAANDPIQ
jgi:pyruvate-formate lyase-activating enzyme